MADPSRRPGAALGAVEEALLRVALLPPDETPAAWRALEPQLTQAVFDDARSVQLVPLVARALTRAGIGFPDAARVRGIARHTFVANQMLLADAATVLAILGEAGVPAVALKGVPLVVRYYDDASLRSMVDFDILVREPDVVRARDALQRAGWRCTRRVRPDFLRRGAELALRMEGRPGQLDLHWRLIPWVDRNGGNDYPELWRDAQPIDVYGRSALAPGAPDLLLHLVLHAFRSGWRNVPRWVADATMVLRGTPDFDWEGFTRRVVAGRLSAPVEDALRYAARLVRLPVPDDVLAALAATDRGALRRRRYAVACRAVTGVRRPLVGQLPDLRVLWARRYLNLTASARLRAAVPFVLAATDADRLVSVPGVVVRNRRAAHEERTAITV